MPARPGRSRRAIEDDEYGDGFDSGDNLPARRTRKVASYNEDDDDDSVDLGGKTDDLDVVDAEGSAELDDEYEDVKPARRESRRRASRTRVRSTSKHNSDDEFFDDGASDEDKFSEENDFEDDDDIFGRKSRRKRPARNTFIATDEDEEVSDDYGYGAKRKKKKVSKKSTPVSGVKSDDELDDDIKKEIEELYDSSPINNTPVKHKLRDRVQKIDYTIPPPLTNDMQLEGASMMGGGAGSSKYSSNSFAYNYPTTANAGRNRKKTNITKNEYRKILFPTAGPFGGSDVISLFGTNIPPGGIPLAPGLSNDASLTAIGQNLSDSDSSEDEIAPINGEATVSKKAAKQDTTANILKSLTTSGNVPGGGPQLINGGGSGAAKGKKNNLSDTDPLGVDMNIDFTAVGGLDNYIDQLKEMVALPLLYPELYQNFKITPPRGVLFHGPPGTGKTLMARALASSYSTSDRKITFFMRKGADCLSKWVGEAERQLRLLFEEAKNQQPSIIFFDEIDGLAPVRSSKQEQIHASIVSTLLALMDGMDNRGQVIVIGATNRPDSIDPALRRPGRFDREFYFPLPDINSRKEILKIHTKGWEPKLSDDFVDKIADLTKGYGGADLRALCTEAALNSIQRKYPQIYKTNDKLKINPSKIKVIAKDFMKAVEKIIPSSLRSTSLSSSPLPDHLKALLNAPFLEIQEKLNELLPNSVQLLGQKKLTILDDAYYVDPSIHDEDGGFARLQLLRNLENSRICKPHLLVCGSKGNGQQYVSSATLNYLEGFQVQSLDMGTLFGDPTRTPESTIIQAFVEARRHQPSILFIPNIDTWFQVVPYSAKATLNSLLRNLKSNEKILLLGIAETTFEELDSDIKLIFGYNSSQNTVNLKYPHEHERVEFFKTLSKTLLMKPYEFINDIQNRPKRKLKELKVVKPITIGEGELTKKKLKEIEYADTKLKNVLKIKLAGLMDLFKNRYKRFKKPVIDENLLYHLYDPAVLDNPLNQYEVLYVKSEDPQYENMIREVSTGRYFFNMDLDIIEERLWNGFYSEPKQFLKDIKMILKDSITFGDRERILKANEMLTNAQFGIDDFSNPEFLKACKEVREREIVKQNNILEQHEKLVAEYEKRVASEQNALEIEAANAAASEEPVQVESKELPALLPSASYGNYSEISNILNPESNVYGQGHENGSVNSSSVSVVNGASHTNELLVTIRSNGSPAVPSNSNLGTPSSIQSDIVPSQDTQLAPSGLIENSISPSDETPTDSIPAQVPPTPSYSEEVVQADTAVLQANESSTSGASENVEQAALVQPVVPKEQEEPVVADESESESEVEELNIDSDRELIVTDQVKQLFEHDLIQATENLSIETLEIVTSKLMDIIWRDRNNWDKTETIAKLIEATDQLKETLR